MAPEGPSDGVRLQKVLAVRGFGSRRIVEDMIEDGRVHVNGELAILGRRVDVNTDRVEVDGVRVGVAPDLIVLPAEQAERRGHDRCRHS